MKLLIVRHAIAYPHGTPDYEEDERPLTPEGRRKFERAARGLVKIIGPPDVLLTSPLPRARQTAEIAAEAWGGVSPTEEPALADGDIDAVLRAIDRLPRDARIAVVGHEPHVSALLGRLLGVDHTDRLEFRKGGAALVNLPGSALNGGRLEWYVRPKILRKLA
jgi:phosphohistidine phosphatase